MMARDPGIGDLGADDSGADHFCADDFCANDLGLGDPGLGTFGEVAPRLRHLNKQRPVGVPRDQLSYPQALPGVASVPFRRSHFRAPFAPTRVLAPCSSNALVPVWFRRRPHHLRSPCRVAPEHRVPCPGCSAPACSGPRLGLSEVNVLSGGHCDERSDEVQKIRAGVPAARKADEARASRHIAGDRGCMEPVRRGSGGRWEPGRRGRRSRRSGSAPPSDEGKAQRGRSRTASTARQRDARVPIPTAVAAPPRR